MPEPAARSGPIDALAPARTVAAAGLTLLPPATRLIFRGREPAIAAAGTAFGIALPRTACRLAAANGRAAWWLGPDEWLLLAPEAEGTAITAALGAALAGVAHALVDVSHRSAGLALEGAQAAYVLSHGCPLDLGPKTFPVGMCTRTLLGKAEIALARTAAMSFRIEVARSFAAYVCQFLDEARRELA
jgi:sarcosine oxidase subunit gamma